MQGVFSQKIAIKLMMDEEVRVLNSKTCTTIHSLKDLVTDNGQDSRKEVHL